MHGKMSLACKITNTMYIHVAVHWRHDGREKGVRREGSRALTDSPLILEDVQADGSCH